MYEIVIVVISEPEINMNQITCQIVSYDPNCYHLGLGVD